MHDYPIINDSGLPDHLQIADHYRLLISTGQLAYGDKLPNIREFEKHGLSRRSVAEALEILGAQGWVHTRQGVDATVLRPFPPRRIRTGRYMEQLQQCETGDINQTTALLTDIGATWDDYTVRLYSHKTMPASDRHRELLHLHHDPEPTVTRRETVDQVWDRPVQIHRRVWPTAIPGLFALHHPGDDAELKTPGGTVAELYALGYPIDRSPNETIIGRAITRSENKMLKSHIGAHVWEITRVFTSNNTPVEVSEVIIPQQGAVFEIGETT